MRFKTPTSTNRDETSITIPDSDVQKLHRAEIQLSDKLAVLRAALAQADAEAGDEALTNVLDAASERTAARRVNSIRSEIAASERAIDAARIRRKAAIQDEYRAQSIPLRREAATKRKEAQSRRKTTDELLAKLREFEGVEYAPYQGADLAPIQMGGNVLGGAPLVRVISTPKTAYLVLEAQTLDAQAAQLEEKPVRESGSAEGSAERIIDAIRDWDAYAIAPTLPSVIAWIEQVSAKLADRLSTVPNVNREWAALHFRLIFINGEIDRTRSEATIIDIRQLTA